MTVVSERHFLSAQIAARRIKYDIKKAPVVAAMDTEETSEKMEKAETILFSGYYI